MYLTSYDAQRIDYTPQHSTQAIQTNIMDIPLSQIKPIYSPTTPPSSDSPEIQQTITTLNLQPHVEGGFYVCTDKSPLRIPNPFPLDSNSSSGASAPAPADDPSNTTRAASTAIFYFLTPTSPLGAFHRNKARTVHTLHWGRGRYVIIHADEAGSESGDGEEKKKVRVESFVVGTNIAKGERLQWVVEGGKYKSSYLLPDEDGEGKTEGLLISEVCCSILLQTVALPLVVRLDSLLTPCPGCCSGI